MATLRERLANLFFGRELRALDNARGVLLEMYRRGPLLFRPEDVLAQLKEQRLDPQLLAHMIRELEYMRLDYGPPDESHRRRAVYESRYLLRTSPLADYTINLWTSFLGGQVQLQAEDKEAQEVWDEFWRADRNAAVLGARYLHELSDAVLRDGEVFFAIFVDEADGTCTVRVLDSLAVVDRIAAPQDAAETVWYRVERLGRNGSVETLYYPDALAWLPDPEALFAGEDWGWRGLDENGEEVEAADLLPQGAKRADQLGEWTAVFVVPALHNRHEGWRGWPLLASGHGWIREHDQFRINRAEVARAVAAFVREIEYEGGTRGMDALARALESTLGSAAGIERNPAAPAGSTLVHNQAVKVRQLGQGTGAGDAAADGEALAWYALLAGKIFPHYAGMGDVSSWATARAMARPQQLVFEQYRAFWASVWRDVARVVFSAAIRYGKRPIRSLAVDVDFPDLLPVDTSAMVAALSQVFSGLIMPLVQTNAMPPEVLDALAAKVLRAALQSAGVPGASEVVTPEAFRKYREEAEKAAAAQRAAVTAAAAAAQGPMPEAPGSTGTKEPVPETRAVEAAASERERWAQRQLNALIALGDDPRDAERWVRMLLDLMPEDADPASWVPSEEQMALLATVTAADVEAARADWYDARWVPRRYKRLLDAQVQAREYDPDQPRDELGRWTSAGGGSGWKPIERMKLVQRGGGKALPPRSKDTVTLINAILKRAGIEPSGKEKSDFWHLSVVPEDLSATSKADIKSRIVERSGLSEEAVHNFIIGWAMTSNENYPPSLALQAAVAQEFGLDDAGMTDRYWQAPFVDEQLLAEARAFVRAVYEETQERLREMGVEKVRLYRGLGLPKDVAGSWETGQEVAHPMRPLSSWSLSREMAEKFARASRAGVGVVLAVDVPRERILSTCLTGLGCLSEAEVLVLGQPAGRVEEDVFVVASAVPTQVREFDPDQPEDGMWQVMVEDRADGREQLLLEAGPLPGYAYDPKSARYRNLETGRYVARREVLNLLAASTRAYERELRAGVAAFHRGQIDQSTFLARSMDLLKRQYVQNAALGAGGWDRLGAAEYGRLGGRLRSEYGYLRNFAQEIANGEVTLEQAINRINLYIGHARAEFFVQERDKLPDAEAGAVWVERRILADVKHCEQCVEYANRGWQYEGVLPLPTEDCDCDGNCRCELERKQVPEAEAAELVGSKAQEYDPDQPRDERGRWTSTGSAAGWSACKAPDQAILTSWRAVDFYAFPPNEDTANLAKGMLAAAGLPESDRPDKDLEALERASEETRAAVKRVVVDRIAERSGLPRKEVDTFLRSWAKSSSDAQMYSVALQAAVAREFGLDDRMMDEDYRVLSQHEELVEKARSFVRAVYAETQEQLERMGVETVRVYRGMQLDPELLQGWRESAVVRMPMRPLSSWSLGSRTAAHFAREAPGAVGVVVAADIPRERIFSTCITGPGCLTEQEVVVLGQPSDRMGEDRFRVAVMRGPLAEYDPDQPRDERGRWVAVGGASSAPMTAETFEWHTCSAPKVVSSWSHELMVGPPDEDTMKMAAALVRAAGAEPEGNFYLDLYNDSLMSHEVRAKVKASIVERISKRSGLTPEMTDRFVRAWAESSSDDNKLSLALQAAAAQVFGLDDRGLTDKYWEQSNVSDLLLGYAADFVRAVYEETQERLQELGVETVRVYRGMTLDDPDAFYMEERNAEVMPMRPLSSWSLNPSTASTFSMGSEDMNFEYMGVVLAAEVPRERIFSTCITGIGCLSETELVVLGQPRGREGDEQFRVIYAVPRFAGELLEAKEAKDAKEE